MDKSTRKWHYWAIVASIWCFLSSILNLVQLFVLDESKISFALGCSLFLFGVLGFLFWLMVALIYASKAGLKKWPLWLMFLHPAVSVLAFWSANQEIITSNRAMA